MSLKRKSLYARFVTLLLLGLVLLVSIYLVTVFLLQSRADAIQNNSAALTAALPKMVQRLTLEPIESLQWYNLQSEEGARFTPQQVGIADSAIAPLTPTNIVVLDTALGQSVLVSWRAVPGQVYTGVEIYRATTESKNIKDMELVNTVPMLSGQWVDHTVEDNVIYYYALRSYRAADAVVASPLSDIYSVIPTDQTPPAAPQWITVTPYRDGETTGLEIIWEQAVSDDVAEYQVYRSTQAGVLGEVIQSVKSTNTLLDTTVKPGVEYFYTVTAHDAAKNESTHTLWTGQYGNSAPFVTGDEQATTQINAN